VQCAADPFAGDLAGRATLVDKLRPKLGGLVVLDQPEGFTGHYGGTTVLFARRYGDCLLRFATEAEPRRAC